MLKMRDIDRFLIITTLILVAFGVVMVYSTSYVVAMKRFGDEYFFVKKHLAFAFMGLILFMIASKVPYKLYRPLAYPALILAVGLLLLIFIPGFGFEAGGARRWVRLGPIAFQPSEPAKLAVIFFLAYSLADKRDRIKSFGYGFLPNILIPGVIITLIVLEPDLGTAVTVAALVMIMVFSAGVQLKYLAALSLLALPVLYGIVTSFGYMSNRITVYLDPWKDPTGAGFQMVQSFIAFGSGGIWGLGLGAGKQKLFYLPEAHTDFILSVIGEELGLVGVGVIVLLYAVFLFCGARIALKAKDLYGMYLALGITFMVVLQAVMNMAVVTGLLPPKGLPLPFISYGGTSLLINMLAVGVLLKYLYSGE